MLSLQDAYNALPPAGAYSFKGIGTLFASLVAREQLINHLLLRGP